MLRALLVVLDAFVEGERSPIDRYRPKLRGATLAAAVVAMIAAIALGALGAIAHRWDRLGRRSFDLLLSALPDVCAVCRSWGITFGGGVRALAVCAVALFATGFAVGTAAASVSSRSANTTATALCGVLRRPQVMALSGRSTLQSRGRSARRWRWATYSWPTACCT